MSNRTTFRDVNAPPLGLRVSIALGVGALAAILLWLKFRAGGAYLYALDFSGYWRGADAFRRGVSPYVAVNAFSRQYPWDAGFLYPLPAAVMFVPFSYLAPQTAAVVVDFFYVATFAFALMRDGYWRLPLLLSYPFIFAALAAQITPLVTAAFLLPILGFVTPAKFTLGAVGFAYNLSWKYALGAIGFMLITIAIWPWWPAQWIAERHDVAGVFYHVPILVPGGFLALAALIRWRAPEARLVAAMACVPQGMLYYDQLPLALVAQSYRECLVVAVVSWLAPAVAILLHGNAPVDRVQLFAQNAPIIIACYYVPATAFVLWRKTR
jgi:hypothetical protein